jgi:hypothetical protein
MRIVEPTLSGLSKPKSIADVVRLLVTQAEQNGEAEYVFRGVTYAAKVVVDSDNRKRGEVWKVVHQQRACVGEPVCKAGFETLPHGVIDYASGRTDFYNSVYFNEDGTTVAYGTWRR